VFLQVYCNPERFKANVLRLPRTDETISPGVRALRLLPAPCVPALAALRCRCWSPFCSGGDGRAARRVLGVVFMAAFLVVSSSRVRIDNLFIKF
jgi:hypothetical protein